MNKPFIAAWGIILLTAAGLIFFAAHSCSKPAPVIQDAPAERVKPIVQRIHEPEEKEDALVGKKVPVHRKVRKHPRAEVCLPDGVTCGAILTRRPIITPFVGRSGTLSPTMPQTEYR